LISVRRRRPCLFCGRLRLAGEAVPPAVFFSCRAQKKQGQNALLFIAWCVRFDKKSGTDYYSLLLFLSHFARICTNNSKQRYRKVKKVEKTEHRKERIGKQSWKPGNVLAPLPVVLVTCGGTEKWQPNIITIAWTGNVCSDPPMLSISDRPERHSHEIIAATGEFAVNVPSVRQARATDWCGMVSGATVDKFAGTGLTPAPVLQVRCPIILECPINIECRVRQSLPLGSHTMFLAEVVGVQVSEALLDAKGKFRLEKAGLLAYGLGHYFALGPGIDHFGFSIRKRKRKPRPA
jgi:flavin reductase (DIM6/NTAB) family NADH-FMN oxidoreductase RutF